MERIGEIDLADEAATLKKKALQRIAALETEE